MQSQHVEMKFGEMKVYLQATDSLTGTGIKETSTKDSAKEKILKAKSSLEDIVASAAESITDKLSKIPKPQTPSSVELSMSIGFSAELDAWVFGAKAEHSIELKLVWSSK